MKRLLFISALALIAALVISGKVFGFAVITNGGKEAYWTEYKMKFYIGSNGCKGFTGGWDGAGGHVSEFDAIRAAFYGNTSWMNEQSPSDASGCDTWGSLSGLNLELEDMGVHAGAVADVDGRNEVFFVSSGWQSLSFNPPSIALAVTVSSFDANDGSIVDADLIFNAEDFDWAVVDTAPEEESKIDIQNIATHEIGHMLGLDHSSENPFESDELLSESTMYYAASTGEVQRRCLNDDDIAGIRHLYSSASVPVPTLSSLDVLEGRAGGYVTIHATGANFMDQTFFKITKNSYSTMDSYGRRTFVSSSSHASFVLDLRYAENGEYDIIVSNSPTQYSVFKKKFVVSGNVHASSSDGDGGCAISESSRGSISFWIGLGLLVFPIVLMTALRVRIRVIVRYKK